MPSWTTEDIAAMFEDDGLISTAAFSHSGGVAVDISVIFDNDFRAVNMADGVIESAGPQAVCKSSDVASAVHGDTLAISGTTYNIIGIEPDGTGMTTLILSKD